MKKILTLATILIAQMGYASPLAEDRIYKDTASMGMGGIGVSTIGHVFSVVNNPANLGLMSDHTLIPFLSLGVSFDPDFVYLFGEGASVVNGDKSYTDLDYDRLANSAPSLGVSGPITAGFMAKGLGVWTTSSTRVSSVFKNNPDNPLGIFQDEVSYNDLVGLGNELIANQDRLGSMSLSEIEAILDKHVTGNLNHALTTADVTKLAENIQNGKVDIKSLLPLVRLESIAEITFNVGYGYKIPFKMIDNVSGLSFGATVRYAHRFKNITANESFVPVDSLADQFTSFQQTTYQAGVVSSDLGASLRIQNWILAIAARDAFSTSFVWKNFDGEVGLQETQFLPSLDVGTSYRFEFNNNFIQEVGLYFETVDLLERNEDFANKIRAGAEVKLFNFFDIRTGVYKKFVTAGVGMGGKWGRVDFAYYRERYFDLLTSDQFDLSFSIGFDNSPRRKAKAQAKKDSKARQSETRRRARQLVDESLQENYSY